MSSGSTPGIRGMIQSSSCSVIHFGSGIGSSSVTGSGGDRFLKSARQHQDRIVRSDLHAISQRHPLG